MYVCNCGGVINMFGGPGSYIAHCLKCQSKGIGSTMDLAVKAMMMPAMPAMPAVKMPATPAVRRQAIEMWNISRQMHPGEMVDPTTPRTGYLTREEYDRLVKAFGFSAGLAPEVLIKHAEATEARHRIDIEGNTRCNQAIVKQRDEANARANRAADENGTLRAKLKDMETRAAMLALELDTLKRKVGR